MGILRKASLETKPIYLDETDYIVVRVAISKKEFNALAAAMPTSIGEDGDTSKLSLPEATGFQRFLFGALVVGWSLNEGQPSIEDYDDLDNEGASVIDTKLAEHFEQLLPSSAEGKSPSTSQGNMPVTSEIEA